MFTLIFSKIFLYVKQLFPSAGDKYACTPGESANALFINTVYINRSAVMELVMLTPKEDGPSCRQPFFWRWCPVVSRPPPRTMWKRSWI